MNDGVGVAFRERAVDLARVEQVGRKIGVRPILVALPPRAVDGAVALVGQVCDLAPSDTAVAAGDGDRLDHTLPAPLSSKMAGAVPVDSRFGGGAEWTADRPYCPR
nr:hypothetical protein [Haloterrigena sp. H1]